MTTPPVTTPPVVPPPAPGEGCLLVDDNPHYLRSARRLLERQGFTVTTAGSGEEALALAAAGAFAVSLVDVHLGAEDGAALAATLVGRGLGGTVVLVSTVGGDELADVVAASGAAGFLAKDELSRGALERIASGPRPGPAGA